ncbi:ankyrin [Microthyrium microscopicum]|uniref:Ankyrin n=1 Tax=Microthyrium microscopicum TaxID=703497 RepID=A0A6A6TUS8_9PEZI|nr:ankyrin [Microthyrium microscopicum]
MTDGSPLPASRPLGLRPVFPRPGVENNTTMDIIAVHGLETEPRGRAVNWLKDFDMLPLAIPTARIWTFDYNANYSDNAQQVTLSGLASTFLSHLKDNFEELRGREILFIGSCFGGIVVADALVQASHETDQASKSRDLLDQTIGAIFLGTPLRGSAAARPAIWKNMLSSVFIGTEASNLLLADLTEYSSRLQSLLEEFARLVVRRKRPIQIICFYETRVTTISKAVFWGLFPDRFMLLVDEQSACIDGHPKFPLDVRHAMMNKFRGRTDPSFVLVAGRLKEMVESSSATALSEEEQECMGDLAFDHQSLKNLSPQRTPGTCHWLTSHEKFVDWRQGTTSDVLWVTAGPGCGKSTLMRALIDEKLLYASSSSAQSFVAPPTVCYYFFKDDRFRGSAANALMSLLHQICLQKHKLIPLVTRLCELYWKNYSLSALWESLLEVAGDPLAGLIIVVMDGLDECQNQELQRDRLIELVRDFYSARTDLKGTLKFILTGRPYQKIQFKFGSILNSIHLDGDLLSTQINKEINIMIQQRMIDVRDSLKISPEAEKYLVENMIAMENKTYLWAYLMIEEMILSLESSYSSLASLIAVLPKSVDDAYEKILARVTDHFQARIMMNLILAADRPLASEELDFALKIAKNQIHVKQGTAKKFNFSFDVEMDEPETFRAKVRNTCGLFINIVDGHVYLLHQTAKEFLTSDTQDNATLDVNAGNTQVSTWKSTFPQREADVTILRACMKTLLLVYAEMPLVDDQEFGKDNIAASWELEYDSAGSEWECDSENHELTKGAQMSAFFDYAICYWISHFVNCEPHRHKDTVSDAYQLCNPQLTNIGRFYPYVPKKTATLFAASKGLDSVLHMLIQKGEQDLTTVGGHCTWPPLLWAIREQHEAVVRTLLETKRISLDTKYKEMSALCLAVCKNNVAIAEQLITAGAYIHTTDVSSFMDEVNIDTNWPDYIPEKRTLPMIAAALGSATMVKLLLYHGADVSFGREDQAPSESKQSNTIESLQRLNQPKQGIGGTAPVVTTSYSTSKFLYSHWCPHKLSMVPWVISSKESKEKVRRRHPLLRGLNEKNWTILHWAKISGCKDTFKELLRSRPVMPNLEAKIPNGQTILSEYAGEGNQDIVQILLEAGAEVNTQDNRGRSPLMYAALGGHRAVFKLVLRKDADVTIKCEGGYNVLSYTMNAKHDDLCVLLVAAGACNLADNAEVFFFLTSAAYFGLEGTVKRLLATGVDANGMFQGYTPIMAAASGKSGSVVELLIDKGVDINVVHNGRSAIGCAAGTQSHSVVQLLYHISNKAALEAALLQADLYAVYPSDQSGDCISFRIIEDILSTRAVDVNVVNSVGHTPLFLAVLAGNSTVVAYLIGVYEADANLSDENGVTPLMAAVCQGSDMMTLLLIEKGRAKVDSIDKHGRTALIWAAKTGNDSTAKILLVEGKADLSLLDKDGCTASMCAESEGKSETVKLLKKIDDSQWGPKW